MKKLIEKHLKKIIFSHFICGLIMTIVFIGILIKLKNGNDIITKFKLNKLDIIFLAFFVFFHLIIFICIVKYNSFSLSMVFLFIPSIPLNIIFFDIYLIKKFPFHFYKETNKIDINDVLLNYCDKYSTKSNDNKDNKQVNDEDNYKKGMVFEYQIINEYIELGYEVKWNALLREKDNGIDLIAKNKDTLIFIQCKNHSNEPNQKDIRAFFADSIWKKYFIDRKKGDLSKYEKLEIVFIYSNKTDNSISNWVKYHRQFNYENTKIDVYEKCIEWDSKKYHMNYKIPEFNPDKWISKKDMNNN